MRHDTEPGLQTHCVLILFLLQSHPSDRSWCGHDMVTEGVTKLCENPLRFFYRAKAFTNMPHAAKISSPRDLLMVVVMPCCVR